jgi:hypothetical protein
MKNLEQAITLKHSGYSIQIPYSGYTPCQFLPPVNVNLIGILNCTLTGSPLFMPGSHLGMF